MRLGKGVSEEMEREGILSFSYQQYNITEKEGIVGQLGLLGVGRPHVARYDLKEMYCATHEAWIEEALGSLNGNVVKCLPGFRKRGDSEDSERASCSDTTF